MQGMSVGQGLLNLGGCTKDLEKAKQLLLHVHVKFVVEKSLTCTFRLMMFSH